MNEIMKATGSQKTGNSHWEQFIKATFRMTTDFFQSFCYPNFS